MLPGSSWNALSERLRAGLEAEDYSLWIEPLSPRSDSGDQLILECPNAFHLNWVREHYLPRMRALLRELGLAGRIKLNVGRQDPSKPIPGAASLPRQTEFPRMANQLPVLNRRFVFDSFVTGQCNEFACAAAKALANGGNLYTNTLFLVSDTGLGKSHLTQAVGHQVIRREPHTRVAYLTAEDFANQMISSIRKKSIHAFKERFRRDCDVLLLEEVQFLAGKKKTQDELGYTLDFLLDAGKRIIFTGSTQPSRIKGLNRGLQSRLGAGVTVPIDPPDHATRVRILERLSEDEGVGVDRELLEFLAQEVTGDVRRLRSALVGLLAKSSLTGRPLDMRLAAEAAAGLGSRPSRITPQDILKTTARVYGMEESTLAGRGRAKAVTRPRNLAMFLCRRHTDASYAGIGKVFNRDHATVMYGVGKIKKALRIDTKLAQEASYLEQKLGVSQQGG